VTGDAILMLNVGSSSVKFAVYSGSGTLSVVLRGKIAGIGTDPVFIAQDGAGRAVIPDGLPPLDRAAGPGDIIPGLLDWVQAHRGGLTIRAAGIGSCMAVAIMQDLRL